MNGVKNFTARLIGTEAQLSWNSPFFKCRHGPRGEGRRYSALEELREGGGVYLGWSNHVLGAGPFTWSEHMKVSPY
jgi:hypothetical protein